MNSKFWFTLGIVLTTLANVLHSIPHYMSSTSDFGVVLALGLVAWNIYLVNWLYRKFYK